MITHENVRLKETLGGRVGGGASILSTTFALSGRFFYAYLCLGGGGNYTSDQNCAFMYIFHTTLSLS